MAAVRRRIEEHVAGPAFDAPLERRFQRLVGRVAGVEREIVAKDDETVGRLAQNSHQRRQALDVLAVDLDQLETAGDALLAVDRGVRRLDQRRLAHAARAPQERIVGGERAGESAGVLDQEIAHPVDAAQERDVHAVDALNRRQRAAIGAPDERFRRVEIWRGRRRRREPVERVGDSAEEGVVRLGGGQSVELGALEARGALPQSAAKLQTLGEARRGWSVCSHDQL